VTENSEFTAGSERRTQLAGSLLLMGCTALALLLANSPWSDAYFGVWARSITFGADPIFVSESVKTWIDDGLMAVFFLLVGLEIKRELVSGELQSPAQAALPIAAAVGGVIAPALVYLLVTAGTPAQKGWAISVATDIAFALGVLALLGSRVPAPVRVFLVSLAIVDDIFAVAIIALFYGHGVSAPALAGAAVILTLLVAANLRNVRHLEVYLILGFAFWVAIRASGLHATIAGVILALCIPADDQPMDFEEMDPPLQRLEHRLYGLVTFGIVPLFALANAGVSFRDGTLAWLDWRIVLAITLALAFGKPLGILAGVALARRSGKTGRGAGAPLGVAWLGGIGFTMSLFIAGLTFEQGSSLISAKVGILAGSLISAVGGWALLRASAAPPSSGAQATVLPFPVRHAPATPPPA
jgi:NhaA family Na+:H+ antiporter